MVDKFRVEMVRRLYEARQTYGHALTRLKTESERSALRFVEDSRRPDDLHLNAGALAADVVRASAQVKLLAELLDAFDTARRDQVAADERTAEYQRDRR